MATEDYNQNPVLWNPVLSDTSTTEILHLRCKDHCGRVGADCKSQKQGVWCETVSPDCVRSDI